MSVEVRTLLRTNGGDPYPCYKCGDGHVYKTTRKVPAVNESRERVVGVCRACDEVCLHNMESAEGLLSFWIRR